MNTITPEKIKMWKEEWENIVERMSARSSGRRGSGTIAHFTNDPEGFITQLEARLDLSLPNDLKALIASGIVQNDTRWSLPDGVLLPLPDVFEGDLGWNLPGADFPLFFNEEGEEVEQRRYLAFHQGGNGDLLLIDLEHPSGSAVVSWSHEEDEFRLLAPSLAEFFDRITKLGLVGAHAGSYTPFLGPDGLEPDCENGRIWQAWLKDYAELDWEKVKGNLPAALRMVEMFGPNQEEKKEIGPLLLERHSIDEVLREWLAWNENESSASNRRERLLLIGDALGPAAADWVRSLWAAIAGTPAGKFAAPGFAKAADRGEERQASGRDASSPGPQAETGAEDAARLPAGLTQDVLYRLTASCLPEEEGLALALRDLEAQASGGRMQPPYSLAAFRSRRIIPWMEPYVSFPIDGWVSLLADSRPAAEDLIRWLRGEDALRMTAVQAIGRLPEGELPGLFAGPGGEPERAELLRLLDTLHAGAVLRKEKAAIQEAIAAISRA